MRLLLLGGGVIYPPDNEIWYTTEDGRRIDINIFSDFYKKIEVYDYDATRKMFVIMCNSAIDSFSVNDVFGHSVSSLYLPRSIHTLTRCGNVLHKLYVCSDRYRDVNGDYVVMYGDINVDIKDETCYYSNAIVFSNGSVPIPDDIEVISSLAFFGKTIRFSTLPKDLKVIRGSAFREAKFVDELFDANNVSFIAGNSFADTNLKILKLKRLSLIVENTFRASDALYKIIVDNWDCLDMSMVALGDAAKDFACEVGVTKNGDIVEYSLLKMGDNKIY